MDKVKADTDGLYYKPEDLYWIVEPTEDDPGVLAPKSGAVPHCQFEEEDLDYPSIANETP